MIDIERKLYIRNLAASFLLSQENLSAVIDIRDMKLPPDIFISTFEEYLVISKVSVDALTCNGTYSDGYTIIIGDIKIILHSENYNFACPQRLRFSLAHEIGHIFLKHGEDDAESEEEANFFASQIVAHDVLVVSMLTGKWEKDLNFIRDQFGISWETAEIKLKHINRNKRSYSNIECQLFKKYKTVFATKKYNRNKFYTNYNPAMVEFDEAYA